MSRISDNNEVRVYGSPWSGKTPCYRHVDYPVGAIVKLDQAPYNEIQRMKGLRAYGAIMAAVAISKNFFICFIFIRLRCKVTKSREQNKRIHSFFCRDGVISPHSGRVTKKREKSQTYLGFSALTWGLS